VLAQSSSPNYRLEESFFGIGGELEASSTNYTSRQSAGETGVGNTSSTNFQANAGFNTTDAPLLEIYVNNTSIDLGVLSPSSATTTTATFYVRVYLASGYEVVTVASPPANESGDTIDALSVPAASSPGTEQFGINLAANTSPATFGADPVQIPDGSFSFGYASPGYDTANVFKYQPGDAIAQSDSSSGRTDYTVSYLYNTNSVSPAGIYTFEQDLVAVSTY
jgi:hypothetical protein